jgi:hypothetical protein
MMAIFRKHPYLLSGFVLAVAVVLFFATHLIVGMIYWSGHQREPVAGWMTVGYVAQSWHLDPREIDATAGLPPPEGHPLSLNEIAKRRGVPVTDVIAEVEAAVAELTAQKSADHAPDNGGAPQND